MAIGIIRFPGTNCDRDVYKAIELAGGQAEYIWWNNEDLTDYDGIVIPGGFSYGDYLRAGAIASNTPRKNPFLEYVMEHRFLERLDLFQDCSLLMKYLNLIVNGLN